MLYQLSYTPDLKRRRRCGKEKRVRPPLFPLIKSQGRGSALWGSYFGASLGLESFPLIEDSLSYWMKVNGGYYSSSNSDYLRKRSSRLSFGRKELSSMVCCGGPASTLLNEERKRRTNSHHWNEFDVKTFWFKFLYWTLLWTKKLIFFQIWSSTKTTCCGKT